MPLDFTNQFPQAMPRITCVAFTFSVLWSGGIVHALRRESTVAVSQAAAIMENDGAITAYQQNDSLVMQPEKLRHVTSVKLAELVKTEKTFKGQVDALSKLVKDFSYDVSLQENIKGYLTDKWGNLPRRVLETQKEIAQWSAGLASRELGLYKTWLSKIPEIAGCSENLLDKIVWDDKFTEENMTSFHWSISDKRRAIGAFVGLTKIVEECTASYCAYNADYKYFSQFFEERLQTLKIAQEWYEAEEKEIEGQLLNLWVVPVQRLPRYELFMKAIVTQQDATAPAKVKKEAGKALQTIKNVTNFVNDCTGQGDGLSRLFLQKALVRLSIAQAQERSTTAEILKGDRELLKVGDVSVPSMVYRTRFSRRRTLYVCNDALLIEEALLSVTGTRKSKVEIIRFSRVVKGSLRVSESDIGQFLSLTVSTSTKTKQSFEPMDYYFKRLRSDSSLDLEEVRKIAEEAMERTLGHYFRNNIH